MSTAFISLGSNLDDPVKQVLIAFEELGEMPQTECVSKSSLYRSEPLVLPQNEGESEKNLEENKEQQPDYVNAVAEIDTALNPADLLNELHFLEAFHGRVREERWGSRPLDLDILLYDDRVITDPELTVPHPGLYERNFVLYPLAEIAPDLEIPGAGPLSELLKSCDRGSLEKIEQS